MTDAYGRYKLVCSKPGQSKNIAAYSLLEAITAATKERAAGFEVVTKREAVDGTWQVVE